MPSNERKTENTPTLLRYGATLPLDSLQPAIGPWNEANSLIFSRLFTIDERGEIVGDLVVEHDISDEGRTHAFTIRRDAVWHDGTSVEPEDVLFSLRAITDPESASRLRKRLEHFESVEVSREGVVVLKLSRPSPALKMQLTEFPVLPRGQFKGLDLRSPKFDEQPIGSGPYAFVGREGNTLRYRAHAAFHGAAPTIEHLELTWYAEDDDRAKALLDDEIDIAQIKPEFVAQIRGADSVRVERFRTGVWRAFAFNLASPIGSDQRIRRAISLLIDREELVDRVLMGMGQGATGPVPPANWAYPPDTNPAARDERRAFLLLQEAGWEGSATQGWWKAGQRLSLRLQYLKHESFRTKTTATIAEQLQRSGIPVALEPIGWDDYRRVDSAGYGANDGDAMVVGWGGLADPYDNMSKKFMTHGDQNKQGYSNPELDTMFEEVGAISDRVEARKLYARIIEIIEEDAVMPALVNPDYVFGLRRGLSGFEGFVLDNFYEFTRFMNRARWA